MKTIQKSKLRIEELMRIIDIEINGKHSSDLRVINPGFYPLVLSGGSLSFGESFMGNWWDCDDLEEFFYRLLKYKPYRKIKVLKNVFPFLQAYFFNLQNKEKSLIVGRQHYDLGNDLFRLMLDEKMIYSCAYWKIADDLDQAQEDKLDLICKKIKLKKGMSVLDIGSGWGSFAKFAAERYGARVVGITISREQVELARENTKGLPVKIRFQDYRDLDEKFDAIVSIGMFEHVGPKNYKTFFQIVEKNLVDDGIFLLHTIGSNHSTPGSDPWINKYIFPGGSLPSLSQIKKASKGKFVIGDIHSFGLDYNKTLLAWHHNFVNSWPKIKGKYGDRFYRMWTYYLLSCAGAFRAKHIHLWQFIMNKNGFAEGYRAPR